MPGAQAWSVRGHQQYPAVRRLHVATLMQCPVGKWTVKINVFCIQQPASFTKALLPTT